MIILQTLLSLASIGLFCAPTGILDLPSECLGNISLFDEFSCSEPCLTYCFKMCNFKMLRNLTEFEEIRQIKRMIGRCQSAKSDVCNYFYVFNDKGRDKLCLDLENWAKLLKRTNVLCYKYRETKLEDMPTEGDDFEDLERAKSYQEMYNDIISKEERYYEGQLKLLKFYGLDLRLKDAESNSSTSTASTMSTIPEGSEYDSEPDSASEWSNFSRE